MFTQAIATGCVGYYGLLAIVTTIGTVQIFRHYSKSPRKPISSHLDLTDVPHVTIIRPCKGLEPFLYECLAATFHQDYPKTRLTIHFCVSSKNDAAYPILQRLVKDYSEYDARIYIEEEDPVVQGRDGVFGPNPKIRNMSRAYREAKGDIVWILDCNIWVSFGALGRMVDKLCGFTINSTTGQKAQTQKPYKLVAHLPVCVDVDNMPEPKSPYHSPTPSGSDDVSTLPFTIPNGTNTSFASSTASSKVTGSKLEQSFLSTAHAKMYVAINSVSIAPCINGKSTAFRISHLNHLTHGQGIDYFGHNICEDHLIGDLLWKSHIPSTLGFENVPSSTTSQTNEIKRSNPNALSYRNHGLAVGDLAIQPVSQMSVSSYIARRVRWLRVRKFTVMLATLVEPCTESLVASAMGAYSVTTLTQLQPVFGHTWTAMVVCFLTSLTYWCAVDWFVSGVIQGMGSVELKRATVAPTSTSASDSPKRPTRISIPAFARSGRKRKFVTWFKAWIGREALAFGIWAWAIWGGTTVTWRDRRFWVGMDMRVHAIDDEISPVQMQDRNVVNGGTPRKGRKGAKGK